MDTVDAAVLAGGKSSRMGRDKALLPFGGCGSLAEYQYRKLQKIFDTVLISSKSDKFDFSADLVLDGREANSPLTGIIALLEKTEKDIFVLGVDMPFVDEKSIKNMLKHYGQLKRKKLLPDILMAETEEGKEPLCAIYGYSALPVLKKRYAESKHRLRSLSEACRVDTLYFENGKNFANLNRPFEYRDALNGLTG